MKERLKSSSVILFIIMIVSLKSYLVQRIGFDLEIETFKQEFILFLTPISATMFVFGLALFLPRKIRNFTLIFIILIQSLLLLGNLLYSRFFNDFVTIPVLFQTSNMGDLGGSAFGLVSVYDIFVFTDIIIVWVILKVKKDRILMLGKREAVFLTLLSIVVFIVNIAIAETERSQLLSRTFDRKILVKNMGIYNYLTYDAYLQSKTKAQKSFAKSENLLKVEEYIQKEKKPGNPKLTGIAKGKNVVIISMESTQMFAINRKINGEEVTPYLNKMIKNKEITYFDNFYHQTAQGKTSDAEFIMDNSLFPLSRGAVYFTHSQNTYEASPKILKENGYFTASMHANHKSFWNRDVMYKNLGYDKYYSEEYYKISDENSVNWGMKDIPFFEQSLTHLEKMPKPFYARMLTLTNHFPFTLTDTDRFIHEYNTGDKTVDRYFVTIRYTDEALKTFFEGLKKDGLWDDTIVVVYGDHYGISENHNKAMSKVMGKEITPFENTILQRTPLFMHVPGMKGEINHTLGGQIDVRPTIMNLLGVKIENDYRFGNDLFSNERPGVVVMRNGDFVLDDYLYTDNQCYSKDFEQPVNKSFCSKGFTKTKNDLANSDKIIYGDLLRFLKK